ncbi:MAG TPA: DNA-directed RNA polymerase subunit N, partial [Patescibacteria group bacterium]|nr:DNA-directed RNA polymerase subunit N [Patescibacteria group bacterium]
EFKERTGKGENAKRVLDDLGLERACCRAMFLGHTDLIELVGKFKKA